jgi:hypothetical protein
MSLGMGLGESVAMSGAKSKRSDVELVLAAELLYLAGDLTQLDGRIAHLLRSRALEIEGVRDAAKKAMLPGERIDGAMVGRENSLH